LTERGRLSGGQEIAEENLRCKKLSLNLSCNLLFNFF